MSEQNYREIFEEAKKQLHNEYISNGQETEFILWFNFDYVEDTNNEITVSVPSAFLGKSIESRGNFKKMQLKIEELTGISISIKYIVRQKNIAENSSSVESAPVQTPSYTESKSQIEPVKIQESSNNETFKKQEKPAFIKHPDLRDDYTFDTFIPGENSIYAYNAAMASAKNPGNAYNPILIYGGVGLGKTHLMQSIGNYIYNQNPKSKIAFITAEDFIREFTNSIYTKTTENFKRKYRNVDVLMIDDIHFLQDKNQTQEELFHTFEAIWNKKGQIVFTCDRPVSELKGFTERLKSRFQRGLNANLQPPDFETKIAIINKKLEILNKNISQDVIEFVAKNCQTNVRDLEASLTKLLSYSELCNKNVTVEMAQNLLRDIINTPLSGTITVETVQKVVAEHYNISLSDIKGKKHTKNIAGPRHIAIYIARNLTDYSFPELGNEFGGRDHTTIMHGYEKIDNQIKIDSSLNSTIQQLIRDIKDYRK